METLGRKTPIKGHTMFLETGEVWIRRKIQAFQGTHCCFLEQKWKYYDPKEADDTFVRNAGIHPQGYTVSQTRRPQSDPSQP